MDEAEAGVTGATNRGDTTGYTVIQVRSRAEAREWAKRFPVPFGASRDGEIEVRRI